MFICMYISTGDFERKPRAAAEVHARRRPFSKAMPSRRTHLAIKGADKMQNLSVCIYVNVCIYIYIYIYMCTHMCIYVYI